MKEAERIYGKSAGLDVCGDKRPALQEANGLAVFTRRQQFRAPYIAEMAICMRNKVIVEGRNFYQIDKLKAKAGGHFPVGRTAPSSATSNCMVTTFESL